MSYDDIGAAGCLLIILGVIALFFIATAFGAWLWGLIAVGVFGLPALSFWQFFGLKLLLWCIIPTSSTVTRKKD